MSVLRRLPVLMVVLPLVAGCSQSVISHPLAHSQSATHSPTSKATTPDATTDTRPDRTTSPPASKPPHRAANVLPVPAWHPRRLGVTADLEPGTLTAMDGRLYAATVDTHHLVRLNPRTGAVVTQSQAVLSDYGVIAPVVSGGLIWDIAQGSRTVLGFNPVTLRKTAEHTVHVTAPASEPVLAPDRPTGGVIFGYAHTITCVNRRGVQRTLRVDLPVSAVALSPDGTRLYVGMTTGAGGELATLSPSTGTQLAPLFRDESMVGLIATPDGVWYGAAGGMSAYTAFMRKDGTVVHASSSVGLSGGGEDDPPTVSGGVAWLGGDAAIGCADAHTGALRAHAAVRRQGYVSALTLVHHQLRAIFHNVNTGQRILIALIPPASCHT